MFAERVKLLRKERSLTQKAVAYGTSITERNYQGYEYGQKKPGHDSLIALADFFDCSVDYLLGRTENPEVNR